MVYLTGSASDAHRDTLMAAGVGLMTQPDSYGADQVSAWPRWAADNGCFADAWEPKQWARWLATLPQTGCLFAVCPDVVSEHAQTLARFAVYSDTVREAGLPLAFVLQEGATTATVPWSEIDAVFVGGSKPWKYSGDVAQLVAEARDRGLWTHMGRVNGGKRIAYAQWIGCQSVDGTFLKYGPDINVPRLLRMLRRLEAAPPLGGAWAP